MAEETVFERIARLKAEEAAAEVRSTPDLTAPSSPEDKYAGFGLEDVDANPTKHERTTEDLTIDGIVNGMTVEKAFKTFLTKEWKVGSDPAGRNEIQMRCPYPGHVDNTPSASWNTSKNTFVCYKCQRGGDAIEIAAIGEGFDWEGGGYKKGIEFVNLRKKIAAKLGYVAQPKAPGQIQQTYIAPAPAQITTPLAPPTLPPAGHKLSNPKAMLTSTPSNVTPISAAPTFVEPEVTGEEDLDADFDYPAMPDFRKMFPENTFLYKYLDATDHLPYPSEYNFWHALTIVGGVLGRDVWHEDDPKVYGNLFVCTVGPTGGGKSQSGHRMWEVLDEVLPYDEEDPNNKGVKQVVNPNSEVFFIQEFQKKIFNPLNPKAKPEELPVKGLLEYPELSGLIAKVKGQNAGRYGSLIIELYDNLRRIHTGSVGGGVTRAKEPFGMMTTTTQLKSLKKLLSDDDASSGFLNRFVFAMGPSVKRGYHSGRIKADMTDAKATLQHMRGFYALNPGGIDYTTDAYDYSDDVWMARGDQLKENDSSELLKRLDLLMKKMTLLFAANEEAKIITIEHVDKAYAYLDYIVECYKVIGARIGVTMQTEMERKVLNAVKGYIIKNPGRPLPTATNISKNLTGKISMKDIRSILNDLAALGIIEVHAAVREPGKGGQPGVRYSCAV
jgi:hypothetical protein